MDLTIPLILGLQIGGNLLLFWGIFTIIKLRNQQEQKEPANEIEKEIKRLSRELKRM